MSEPKRACPDCGEPEHRRIENGRELVNLDPVTSRCLECLVKAAKGKTLMFETRLERDHAKAAANDVED